MKWLFALIFVAGTMSAYDASPRCYKELQTNFFDSRIVMEALALHYVPQNSWTPIARALATQSQQVPQVIRAQSMRLQPNPLDPVFLPEQALELLRSVLLTVFTQVVSSYNFNQESNINQGDIQAMFDYISNKQAYRIERCFGQPNPNAPQNLHRPDPNLNNPNAKHGPLLNPIPNISK